VSYSLGHRKQLRQELLGAFAVMSATEWEYLGHALAEHITGERLQHRGLTTTGNPSSYTVDSYSSNGRIVAEYGTEAGYFDDLTKPQNDLAHARREAPQAEIVLLLSNQVAGPTAKLDVAHWCDAEMRATGLLLTVYDGRELADVILDDVLPRGRAAAIAPYLAPIRRLMQEQAASHQLPTAAPGALARPALVARLEAALDAHPVVLLSGISGIGKTEAAVAVAASRGPRHDRVVWVPSPHLSSAAALEAVDVAEVGLLQNLRGMLESRSCLVVLDDLQTDGRLESLVEAIAASCGPDARVLITSQVGTGASNDVPVPFLEEGNARQLLEQDVGVPCPDDVFTAVWRTVNGHPFTLHLLNASVRAGGDWDAVRDDIASVGTLPILERRQTLATRIVARARDAVEPALALFLWAGSSRVHEAFARAAVGASQIRALHRLAFVAGDAPDTLRLHDIVWESVRALRPPLAPDADRWSGALDAYVRRLGQDDAGTLELNHVARLHQGLLRELVRSPQGRDGHLYAWLHHLGPGQVARDALPDPSTRAIALVGPPGVAGAPVPDFAVQVTVELAETTVRLATQRSEPFPNSDTQASLLQPFDVLLASPRVSEAARLHVAHHRAKALKRLRRELEAVRALEALLAGADRGQLAASRLLLARLLTEPRVARSRTDARTVATPLLFDLLDEAAAAPDRASVSIVLAAAELLRRHVLALDLDAAVRRYAALLAPMIVRAGERGLEQGVLAFAALGAAWLRVDRAECLRLYRSLPTPARETMDANELEAWGELLIVVADELNAPEREATLEQARDFLTSARSRYGTSHAADALIRLGRPAAALELIDEWAAHDPGAREDPWMLLRRSDAQAAAGEPATALENAREAVRRLAPGNPHRRRFLDHLARRLEAVGELNEARSVRDSAAALGSDEPA
jgi:hypothetical protein